MAETAASPGIVKIPPPVWALVMLGIAYGLQQSFGFAAVVYVQSTIVAAFLFVGGLTLTVSAMHLFAAAETEIIPASPANKALVTGGPFRFTRNPMYVGLTLAASGSALYFGTLPFLAVPVLLFLLIHFAFVPFEEAKMLRQFGTQYTEYCVRVRRWL